MAYQKNWVGSPNYTPGAQTKAFYGRARTIDFGAGHWWNTPEAGATHDGVVSIFTSPALTVVTTYTEVADYGSDFNNTTGVFTAPYAGLYHFDACMGMTDITSTADGRWETSIYVNGVVKSRGFADADTTNGDPAVVVSLTIPLAANDTVDVRVSNITGGAENLDGSSFFAGYLVGQV